MSRCNEGGNGVYIPTWSFTSWLTDIMYQYDEPCIKRVRSMIVVLKVFKNYNKDLDD